MAAVCFFIKSATRSIIIAAMMTVRSHQFWITALLIVLPAGPAALAQEPLSAEATEAVRLLDSDDPFQQQTGFLRLEALREPATVGIIRAYLDHADPDLRAWSVRALAAVEGTGAIDTVLHKLQTDKHPDVRRAALLGLEVFQPMDPRLLPAFISSLTDRHSSVRMTAVDLVSRIDHPDARQAITVRYRREHRRDVRRVLESAMKRLRADHA